MQTVRIVGTVFLGLALLLGLFGMFAPTGEAWIEKPGLQGQTRTTDTFGIWGVDTQTAPEGANAATVERGWYDSFHDETGGITYLRAAPVFTVISLLLVVTALLLTAMPGVREGISGGIVAIFAFLGLAAGMVLHTAGLLLRTEHLFTSSTALLVRYGLWLLLFAALLVFTAMVLGLRSQAEPTQTHRDTRATHHAGARRLMCPRCNTINEAHAGSLPTCYSCGYSS